MARYTDVDSLTEHKFPDVTFDRYVSDGKPKSEKEIYAYKVGYNEAIDGIVKHAQTAPVVDKDRYDRLLENSIILSEALIRYQGGNYVEVVRCKDCRFWRTETDPIGIECEPGETAHYCKLDGMIWRSSDFCKYGDKKGDSNGTH